MSGQAVGGAPAQGGVALPPTTEQLQTAFDSGIWYALSLWHALHVAVQNSWGGPDSSEKFDWFAGAVSEYFTSESAKNRKVEEPGLSELLLQVMWDEFGCNVDDESDLEVARSILVLREALMQRDMSAYQTLERRWKNRGQMKANVQVVEEEGAEVDEEEFEGFSDDDVDVEMDVDMDGNTAPTLVPAIVKEKVEPVVDDDGFTKVVGKKKR